LTFHVRAPVAIDPPYPPYPPYPPWPGRSGEPDPRQRAAPPRDRARPWWPVSMVFSPRWMALAIGAGRPVTGQPSPDPGGGRSISTLICPRCAP